MLIVQDVPGTLVKSSTNRLITLTILLFFLHFGFFIYRLVDESTNVFCIRVHNGIWASNAFVLLCGVVIPLYGYIGAFTNRKSHLIVFACLQYCLSLLKVFNMVNMIMLTMSLKDGCEQCSYIFEQGDDACQYGRGNGDIDWVQISRSNCDNFPTIMQIGLTIFFMTVISGAECYAAFTAHQIVSDKHIFVQIIHTEPDVDRLDSDNINQKV